MPILVCDECGKQIGKALTVRCGKQVRIVCPLCKRPGVRIDAPGLAESYGLKYKITVEEIKSGE